MCCRASPKWVHYKFSAASSKEFCMKLFSSSSIYAILPSPQATFWYCWPWLLALPFPWNVLKFGWNWKEFLPCISVRGRGGVKWHLTLINIRHLIFINAPPHTHTHTHYSCGLFGGLLYFSIWLYSCSGKILNPHPVVFGATVFLHLALQLFWKNSKSTFKTNSTDRLVEQQRLLGWGSPIYLTLSLLYWSVGWVLYEHKFSALSKEW